MPLPDKVMIDAPEVSPDISNVPLAVTLVDCAIEAVPVSARVPEDIVVRPE